MEKYIKETQKKIKEIVKEIKETFNIKEINLSCVIYRDFKNEYEVLDEK